MCNKQFIGLLGPQDIPSYALNDTDTFSISRPVFYCCRLDCSCRELWPRGAPCSCKDLFIKNRSKHSSKTLLSLLWFFMNKSFYRTTVLKYLFYKWTSDQLNIYSTFFSSKLDSLVIKTLERVRFSSNQNIWWKKNVQEMFNWSEVHPEKKHYL
jgi:hypothetical protein